MTYYLAIDIGASSGRHILSKVENNKIEIEEVYRFKNNVVEKNGHYYWDTNYLFNEIKEGIKEAVRKGKKPKTIGIDTWAVDYVLLDQNNQKLSEAFAYRDLRVDQVIRLFNQIDLYNKTGIQFQKFNTFYQLKSEKEETLKKVKSFLMIPDYFHYLLTGKKVNEYTNMTTTQLVDYKTKELRDDLLAELGVSKEVFQKIVLPGTNIGPLSDEMQKELGLKADVVIPATHDTGSAFMASIEDNSLILSSGTWSLLGIESKEAIVNESSLRANFTNEGGYNYRYRFLKNIMGLWIIQEVSREFAGEYSFGELVELARKSQYEGIFDVNDERFLNPKNMVDEIISYFNERHEEPPHSIGEISYCVYNSLAMSYKQAIEEIEAITHKTYSTVNVIGGGCQNILLNEMIATITGKRVLAGPVEATALGNILAQMISDGAIKDLNDGRKMIKESFEIKEYKGEE